jgi:hypothetical protein
VTERQQQHRAWSARDELVEALIHAVSKSPYVALIRARLHSALYRREREHYPEYIDHGGEG